jgi:hypothetical protein
MIHRVDKRRFCDKFHSDNLEEIVLWIQMNMGPEEVFT